MVSMRKDIKTLSRRRDFLTSRVSLVEPTQLSYDRQELAALARVITVLEGTVNPYEKLCSRDPRNPAYSP
jgi:hypothetical protein